MEIFLRNQCLSIHAISMQVKIVCWKKLYHITKRISCKFHFFYLPCDLELICVAKDREVGRKRGLHSYTLPPRRVIHGKLNTSSNNHFSEGSLLYFWPFLLSQPFGSNLAQYTALPAGLNCKSNFFCEVFGSKRLIIGWFFSANIPFPAQIVDLQRPKLLPNYCFFGHLVACWPVAFVFANGCLLTTTAYNSTIAHLSFIFYSVAAGKKLLYGSWTIKNTQQSKVNQTPISVSSS